METRSVVARVRKGQEGGGCGYKGVSTQDPGVDKLTVQYLYSGGRYRNLQCDKLLRTHTRTCKTSEI